MMTATLSRIKLLSHAAEQLIGPLLVFVISYSHHIYFANGYVSSSFAAVSLISLLLVMAVDKTGILLGLGVQLAFLGWIAIVDPLNLVEQLLFSTSVSLSLFATYVHNQPESLELLPTSKQDESSSLLQQKEKLWQELFDARQEIKTLYEQNQALETCARASNDAKVNETKLNEINLSELVAEKEQKIALLQHHLEALVLEKQQFVEDRATCEEDLKKFASHMHEMALYQETLRQEILRLEELKIKEQQNTEQRIQQIQAEAQLQAKQIEKTLQAKLDAEAQNKAQTESAEEIEKRLQAQIEQKLHQKFETEFEQQLQTEKQRMQQEIKENLVRTQKEYSEKQAQQQEQLLLKLEQLEQENKAILLKKAQVPHNTEDKPSQYEAMYRQLKIQFEDKAKTLDIARKELFQLQDELDVLKRTQQENLEATPEEKHLMQELLSSEDKLDTLKRAQEEELVGYEEVIQGLLNQLHEKTTV